MNKLLGKMLYLWLKRQQKANTVHLLPALVVVKDPPEYTWVYVYGGRRKCEVLERGFHIFGTYPEPAVRIQDGYVVKWASQRRIDLMQRDHARRGLAVAA